MARAGFLSRWKGTFLATLLIAVLGVTVTPEASAGAPPPSTRTLAATAGCGRSPTLTSGSRTMQSGGKNRTFILRLPDGYDSNRPYRLIFGFHWNGGTANDVDGGGTSGYPWSYYGLRALAGNSAIFVAPQGLNNGWANSGGEDLAFVDAMVNLLESGLCVDTSQLFSLGFSYGGGMSYAIACARATVFRAVAVYSGGQLSGCSGGTQPIAYLGLHGLRDPVLNISNGRSLRDRFVRNNGCTAQNPPEPAQGSLTHTITYYQGCRAGYPVAWAAFDAGHTPGPVDGSAGDYNPGERSWTRPLVWSFFSQFGSAGPVTSRIVGAQSGRCVDLVGGTTANGAATQLWDCTGAGTQSWTYTAGRQLTGSGGAKCLDASGQGAANGTAVIVWDCNGQANQQWNVNADGTITGVQSGLCLDATGAATANGTRLDLWSCNGGANQQWSVR
ncbi:ricin-type beta-trefoil lectin domain protein [Actinoplanes sp. NPDC020271]|uniref:ricin-type beta-trefoil lectin domain protein n=1 Tax=Actinoplanes sp. NPDC020271 TaxID=3363896 RepID=UPI0037A1907F